MDYHLLHYELDVFLLKKKKTKKAIIDNFKWH